MMAGNAGNAVNELALPELYAELSKTGPFCGRMFRPGGSVTMARALPACADGRLAQGW